MTVTGNVYGANGHCYVLKDTYLDPMILYGGIYAENPCGYTRAKRPYGTDGQKKGSMVKCLHYSISTTFSIFPKNGCRLYASSIPDGTYKWLQSM